MQNGKPGTINLQVKSRYIPLLGLSARELHCRLALLLDVLDLEDVSLEIRITDDAEIATLNQRFLGCTGPTNVLSFPVQDEDHDIHGFLGSIILSADTLLRECRLYGQREYEHLLRLLTHAILHLTGMEHGAAMEIRTDTAVRAMLNA